VPRDRAKHFDLIVIFSFIVKKHSLQGSFAYNNEITCHLKDMLYSKSILRTRRIAKISFVLFMTSLFLLAPYLQSYSVTQTVEINEVEYNPPGPVAHKQWIELYNKSQDLLDIGGWLVKSTKLGKTFKIPDGFVILPNDYLVIPLHSVMFALEHESVVLLTPDSVEVDRTPELSDTNDDDLTWQRFPNAVDTDTPDDWAFRNSAHGASNGFPVERQNFTLSVPIFVDQEENKVESFTAGQMAGVKSEIINQFAEERTFAYIVKISDEEGFPVFISWVEDLVVLPNRTIKPAIFWFAEERGNFLVEVFAWRSLNIPEILTPAQSGLLRIAG